MEARKREIDGDRKKEQGDEI